jgi:hypothetical protein
MLFMEAFLQGMELAILFKTLDGGDLTATGLDCEHGTGLGSLAIDNNCACSATCGIAANVRAGQAQIVTKPVDEQRTGFDVTFIESAIDRYTYMMFAHLFPSCGASERFS